MQEELTKVSMNQIVDKIGEQPQQVSLNTNV